jgi:hypothetical protein
MTPLVRRGPSLMLLMVALAALTAGVPASVTAQTLTVTDGGNDGPGTLRDLVARAGPNATIVVPSRVTVRLVQQIVITKDLTIVGNGIVSG